MTTSIDTSLQAQERSTTSAQPLIHILGISGSLRSGSFNTLALQAAAEMLPSDATLDILDLSPLPVFNQDLEVNMPGTAVELKRRVRQADALLVATPEHNYSITAALKNALDWASRPAGDNAWSGKPTAILGAAPGGVGTARAQYHLRQMFVYLNVFPLNQPEVMIVDAARRFDSDGRLVDDATRAYIARLVQDLVEWTRKLKA